MVETYTLELSLRHTADLGVAAVGIEVGAAAVRVAASDTAKSVCLSSRLFVSCGSGGGFIIGLRGR